MGAPEAGPICCTINEAEYFLVFMFYYQDFAELYFKYISSWEPFSTELFRVQVQNNPWNEVSLSVFLIYDFCSNLQIKEWITNFTKLGEKRKGYGKEQVTVYTHAAAYHIPQMVEKNDNIKTVHLSR